MMSTVLDQRPSKEALRTATHASLQALANCYLREVDSGTWRAAASWRFGCGVRLERGETHVVQLTLRHSSQVLALGVSYRSLVGRHRLESAYLKENDAFRSIDALSAQLLLIDSVYALEPWASTRLELLARLIASHQTMAQYIDSREEAPASSPFGFIESEQSTVFGHWLHPTPKSRQGIHPWQHELFAPELGGSFQLHFFRGSSNVAFHGSSCSLTGAELSRALAAQDSDSTRDMLGDDQNSVLIPVHPIQADWLRQQPFVRKLLKSGEISDLGPLGPLFSATSSVRTLYCESEEFMVKTSLPVKLTNSLRINLKSELEDSIWVSKYLRVCGHRGLFPDLEVIEDPAFVSLSLPGMAETGFETIFRQNPFRQGEGNMQVHSIASLVQDGVDETEQSRLRENVCRFARSSSKSLDDAAREWFDAYLKVAIEPAVRSYDEFGVAWEAHQQNSLLLLDERGLPVRSYYRDVQGLGLNERYRARAIGMVPELASLSHVFESDAIVRQAIGYYLVSNQLYSVVHRFGVDELVSEAELLQALFAKLTSLEAQLGPLGSELVDMLLREPKIPTKANLLTRLEDRDELQSESELAVYVDVPNPLARLRPESPIVPSGARAVPA